MPFLNVISYQPHPLHFLWAFLVAGLLRNHTSLRGSVGSKLSLQLIAGGAAADLFGYWIFVQLASLYLDSPRGLALAWLISTALCYHLRYMAAKFSASFLLGHSTTARQKWLTVVLAAVSSTAVLLLALCLLKIELEERGAALDAARYAWHIATSFLGLIFAPACTLGRQPHMAHSLSDRDLTQLDAPPTSLLGHILAHLGLRDHHQPPPKGPSGGDEGGAEPWRGAGLHGAVWSLLRTPHEASPLADSAVVIGALGVLPRTLRWPFFPAPEQRRARRARATARHSAAARTTLGSVGMLAAYLLWVRVVLSPARSAGPFIAPCEAAASAAPSAGEAAPPQSAGPELVTIGSQWSLLGLMYGPHTLAIPRSPTSCLGGSAASADPAADPAAADAAGKDAAADTASEPSWPGLAPRGAGIVMAADGSQPKYANAVFLGLHNIRRLGSDLPAEVFHVGEAERFDVAALARMHGLGHVQVVDMLPRLHPSIREDASRRLRSFACKPFAALASSFDHILLADANALFFAKPDDLFSLYSYQSAGVQLFADYIRSFRILDPWLITTYLGRGERDLEAYRKVTGDAEIDSSVVLIDRRRRHRYLHLVCALNWWRGMTWRHTWGDKDTWALAAVALGRRDRDYRMRGLIDLARVYASRSRFTYDLGEACL